MDVSMTYLISNLYMPMALYRMDVRLLQIVCDLHDVTTL